MRKIRQISIAALMLFLILLGGGSASAQSKIGTTAVPTLLWQNSPRTKAMGGCSITLVDEQSQFYNPAAMGVFSLENMATLNISQKTDAAPRLDNGNIMYYTRGVSARIFPYSPDLLGDKPHFAFAAAYGFGKARFTLRPTSYDDWDGSGYPEGYEMYLDDVVQLYSYSFAFRAGASTVGLGYTHKNVRQNMDGFANKGTCYDVGVFASLDLTNSRLKPGRPTFYVEVLMGFVHSNDGSMKFLTATYDFPKVDIFGMSAIFGYYNQRNIYLTLMPTFQSESFEQDIKSNIKRLGLEAGFNEAVFGRIGYAIDEFDNEKLVTFGFGLSSRGIYKNILHSTAHYNDSRSIFCILDLKFDYARSKLTFIEKTNFYNVSISL